jgi:hypothetical protein
VEEGFELTVSDDLLLETVLCPAVEFVLVLSVAVAVERLVVPLVVPDCCLSEADCEADLLPVLFPDEVLDTLSG